MALFAQRIDGFASWAKVFQGQEAFLPLAQAMYAREGLAPPARLSGLTPGTNAVFRAGETVIKIFAPDSSGFSGAQDFAVESRMLAFASAQGIRTSTPIASGCLMDLYPFCYLIMEYIDGKEAGDILGTLSAAEKERFAQSLRALLARLHRPGEGVLEKVDIVKRAIHNERLERLPTALAADMRKVALAADLSGSVLVHGDITGENVLIGDGGEIFIIDFADSCVAPAHYEWPPLLFELMRMDQALIRAFLRDESPHTARQRLKEALALHDFGADIMAGYANREGIPLSKIKSMDAFMDCLPELC